MVCAGEETVTGIRACHIIEQFREYPVPGVSCGSTSVAQFREKMNGICFVLVLNSLVLLVFISFVL